MKKGSPSTIDVSDANATTGDVKSPKTFYAGTPGKKVGVMVTRTLDPANENVLEGFYEATLLSTVEVDLITGNIKSGITIFGKTGPATVQDISGADAAVGDVRTGKTFFSVTGAEKTGTIAEVAIVNTSENVPAGIHTATTLSAIDADLVAANIRDGTVIFGITGSLEEAVALLEDTISATRSTAAIDGSSSSGSAILYNIAGSGELDVVTKTDTYDSDSLAVAAGCGIFMAEGTTYLKARLYMEGVQVAESGYLVNSDHNNVELIESRALSGSEECKFTVKNYDASERDVYAYGADGSTDHLHCTLTIGSVKQG